MNAIYENKNLNPCDAMYDSEVFKEILHKYCNNENYRDTDVWYNTNTPWQRQLRPRVIKYLDFSKPVTPDVLLNYTSMAANRILTNIYEQDFVFLTNNFTEKEKGFFERFYNQEDRLLADVIRPAMENYLFNHLEKEVQVTGKWTLASFKEYFSNKIENLDVETKTIKAIRNSKNQKKAFEYFMMQCAPDFLTESSQMARNILGSFGEVQSELFKVLIDEYGYGSHKAKHSTLFEDTLASIGLSKEVHTYWQFYLTSTLYLNNYFHYITKNHEFFFRYIGAITLAENTFGEYCESVSKLQKEIYGKDAFTEYFKEHAHVDKHHAKMTLEKILIPLIEMYGDSVIPEIVRGIEETEYFQDIATDDFVKQVEWMDSRDEYKELGAKVTQYLKASEPNFPLEVNQFPVAKIVEPLGELSVTHVHDGDELCYVESGVLHFISGPDNIMELNPGEATVIQRNRLHGAIVDSKECIYHIVSIGDHKKCL